MNFVNEKLCKSLWYNKNKGFCVLIFVAQGRVKNVVSGHDKARLLKIGVFYFI